MTRRGFTLIELLMAVIITAIMMTVCFITFNTAIRCWSRSAAVADTVRNAEYALTQVISGLRSARPGMPTGLCTIAMSSGLQPSSACL